jgi:hypothetical protein
VAQIQRQDAQLKLNELNDAVCSLNRDVSGIDSIKKALIGNSDYFALFEVVEISISRSNLRVGICSYKSLLSRIDLSTPN